MCHIGNGLWSGCLIYYEHYRGELDNHRLTKKFWLFITHCVNNRFLENICENGLSWFHRAFCIFTKMFEGRYGL